MTTVAASPAVSTPTPKVHDLAKAGFGTGTNELYDKYVLASGFFLLKKLMSLRKLQSTTFVPTRNALARPQSRRDGEETR